MTHTIDKIKYFPKVGALDVNGTVHFELDITEDAIALYPTAYNPSNGTIERISGANLFTDENRDISIAIPEDE